MSELMDRTSQNTRLLLNVCMGYGSMEEIAHAVNSTSELINAGEHVDQTTIMKNLYIDTPVDLMIRTGETRLSNFLLYQSFNQTHLLFIKDVYWPELTVWHFMWMMLKYQQLI